MNKRSEKDQVTASALTADSLLMERPGKEIFLIFLFLSSVQKIIFLIKKKKEEILVSSVLLIR